METPTLRDSEPYLRLVRRLRIKLLDEPGLNLLVPDQIFSDDRMEVAIEDAVDDWNSTPPPIGDITFFDHPSPGLLSLCVMTDLLRHEALNYMRNGVDFSDGGTSVSDTNRGQQLMAIADRLYNQYQAAKEARKMDLNIAQGWGGSWSEYGVLAG